MKKRSSKKTSLRIGDRFVDTDDDCGDIWEVVGVKSLDTGYYPVICIAGSVDKSVKTGYKSELDFTEYYWNYLGNFSKQDSFIELYNLFNDTK